MQTNQAMNSMITSNQCHEQNFLHNCLCLAVVFLAEQVGLSQGFQNRFSMPEGLLMTAPREVEVLLSDAQEAIDAKQWAEASVTLGQLLGIEESAGDGPLGEDYFLSPTARTEDGARTVLGQAKKMLENLPEEAKQAVELRYGVKAQQLLEQAIDQNDIGLLHELSSRYGFTDAGRDASMLLAEHLLTIGNTVDATNTLERLLSDRSARDRFGAGLGVLAVASKLASSTTTQAGKLLVEVREYFPSVSLDWAGSKVGWNDKTTGESILQSLSKEDFKKIAVRIRQPRFEGGGLDRNANTDGGQPIPILRWSVDLHESAQHKENLERTLRKQLAERRAHLVPTRAPISSEDLIFLPTYDQRILAIDAKSGKIRWPIVFSGSPLGYSIDRGSNRDSYALGLPAPDYLVRRVWGDFATSQISTDGKRIFGLSGSSAAEVGESFAVGPNARQNRNPMIRTYNVLQAWSIAEEGKLLWECGGVNRSSALDLKGALFLGAPIPVRSELLVLAELNGEVFLVSLEPGTGTMNWRQSLVANQGTTIALDPQRKAFGLSPSLEGSLVICPTLSGFLVAYDLNRRELVWSKSYPMNPSLMPGAAFNIVGGMDLRETDPMLSRSLDTAVVVHDGVSVFAPSNGTAIYGISNADGAELWQIGHDEGSMFRYVAGVWNQLAVLVYAQEIVGVDLRTGQPAWAPVPIPNGAHVVGKSVRSDSKLIVPLSNQQLIEIDLLQGSVLSETRCEKALGNLAVVDNRLLSASPFELTSYSIRDRFQADLIAELKNAPGTASVLQKEGELALASGEIDKAMAKLEEAIGLSPQDFDIRRSFIKALTMALRTDFDRYIEKVRSYESIASDLDLPTYLRVMIHGLEKRERWSEAFEKLLELSDTRLSRRIDQMMDGNSIDASARWTIHEDAWISARLARIARRLSDSEWETLRVAIEKRLEVDPKQDPSMIRLRLQHFDGLPYTQTARLNYANSLGVRSMVDAEYLLTSSGSLEKPLDEADQAIRKAKARLYLKSERPMKSWLELGKDDEAFLAMAKELSGKNGPGILRYNSPDAMLIRFKERELADLQKHSWPQGKVEVTSSFAEANAVGQFQSTHEGSNLCQIGSIVGDSFLGWQAYFNNGLLHLVQSQTGEEVQYLLDVARLDRTVTPRIHAINSILIIELKDQVIALDLFHANLSQQDGQLWNVNFGKENLDQEMPGLGRGRSNTIERNAWGLPIPKKGFRVVDVSRWGVIVQSENEIVSFHPLLGTKQWSLQGFRTASLLSKGGFLYSFETGSKTIQKIDPSDGSVVEEIASEQEGWTPLTVVADRWLFQPVRQANTDQASRMKLRLVEPSTGENILQADHTLDTRLAIAGDLGVVALRSDGNMLYWNARKGTESKFQVDVEGKFSSITAQVFGDIALILPHAGAMELDNVQVFPQLRSDPTVAACAGRLFAIQIEDGSLAWERSQRVKHFLFPLSQSRQSPAAVFLRRLTLKNVRGMALDFTSIALIDVRTGKLLYQKHDLPAVRGDSFRQLLLPAQNQMSIKLYGNLFQIVWTDEPWEQSAPDPATGDLAIGELDLDSFQASAEELADKIKKPPAIPGNLPRENGNLDPPIPR